MSVRPKTSAARPVPLTPTARLLLGGLWALATVQSCTFPDTRPSPIVWPTPTSPAPSVAALEPLRPSQPVAPVYADLGFEVHGGGLLIDVRAAGKPVEGAWVRLLGPSLAAGGTKANGQLTLSPILPGSDYRLWITTPGLQTVISNPFTLKANSTDTLTQRFELKAAGRLRGRVVADGQGVAGAVVSDGLNSAVSDPTGEYELPGVAPGQVRLTASKPRFQLANQTIAVSATVPAVADFSLSPAPATLTLDTSLAANETQRLAWNDRFRGLSRQLAASGWTIKEAPAEPATVWVLAGVARDLTRQEIERLTDFVSQGGKLIVLGEWGGSAGFRTSAANTLLHGLGAHLAPDLVRDFVNPKNPNWITVQRFLSSHPSVAEVRSWRVYGASSVFGLWPLQSLAETSKDAFRLQSSSQTASQSLLVGGPFKAGKVIVVGDTSCFTDEDSDRDGQPNLADGDNFRLVERLLSW
ncbi:MAG: DUF4350 domain-containing protein [Candidatus Sericytochromatia bacterium]|nr:DUF4350 domain-containing protein [Candidatus Sericytochromatia bacterium]